MMYAWKCSKCHHEWQTTVNIGAICEWCGADGVCLGKDKAQWPPMSLLQSMVDNGYPKPVVLPSHQYKKMTGGSKEI